MGLIRVIKYLLHSKNDIFLFLSLEEYVRYKWIVKFLVLLNKNYIYVNIFRKKHGKKKNIVVVGLKYYGRNVRRKSSGIKNELLKKKDLWCLYCDTLLTKDNITGDHIIPLSKGGNNSRANMVACCNKCNLERADTPFYTFLFKCKPHYKNKLFPFI